MIARISTERVFSLPCFEGLRLLRRYTTEFPNEPLTDLLSLISRVEADAESLDMEASVYLSTLVETDCPLDGPMFYQSCIRAILLKHQPLWARAMRSGRKRFVRTLEPDDQDVFAAAGLLDDFAPYDVVSWWDEVSGLGRVIADHAQMEQAREAELLTIEQERLKLKDAGIFKEPEWPGLDDNFAGYDVLSYEYGSSGIENRLIEVKSTIVSPLRFYVTQNEWGTAKRTGDPYIFHIWDMSKTPPILHVRRVDDVAPHIPSDNGNGRWNTAIIPIGSTTGA